MGSVDCGVTAPAMTSLSWSAADFSPTLMAFKEGILGGNRSQTKCWCKNQKCCLAGQLEAFREPNGIKNHRSDVFRSTCSMRRMYLYSSLHTH